MIANLSLESILVKAQNMLGGSFQGRFDDIYKIKNIVSLSISGFLLTGGFLSSRGVTTEAVLTNVDG